MYEEFFVQGDKEKELGLPIGMFNDRRTINLADAQIGYITVFIQPSFNALSLLLPHVKIQ